MGDRRSEGIGNGGAGVAVANDATASYWNPAAFGFFKNPEGGGDYGERNWSIQLFDVGVGAQSHEDFAVFLSDISKFDFTLLSGAAIPLNKVSDFIQLLDTLKTFDSNQNRALTILGNAGLRTQFGHFGIGGFATLDVTARGDLDLVNISPTSTMTTFTIDDFTNPANYNCPAPCNTDTPGGLDTTQRAALDAFLTDPAGLAWTGGPGGQATNFINAIDNGLASLPAGTTIPPDIVTQIENVATLANTAASSGGTFANNTSTIQFKGIGIAEFPLTYGLALSDDLAIGGNIKFMKARVYNTVVKLFNTDFNNALDLALDDFVESEDFGVDIGFLYRLGDSLRFGIVGRNLNSPEFDMKKVLATDPDHLEEKPQVRAGLAYKPASFITLAADIDLAKNETTVGNDFESQTVGAGVEFTLKIIQLRAGAFQNLAEDDIGLVYTAGLGINLWLLNFDIGAALSKDSTEIDGDDIPEEARVEFALSMLF
ncbi:MAG: conjugal transfer protein TraF [Nitrospiria bacterium]